jgi:ParB/RepB/Spo0J family partition protein
MNEQERKPVLAFDKKEVLSPSTPVPTEVGKVPMEVIAEDYTFKMRLNNVDVSSLKDDIEHNGQKIPIVLRPHPVEQGKFQIVAGFRRYTSLKELKAPDALASIYEGLSDQEAFRVAVAENVEREDYSPEDVFNAILKATEKARAELGKDPSSRDVSLWVGMSYKSVQRYRKLATYPELARSVLSGELSLRKALKSINPLSKHPDFDGQVKEDRMNVVEALETIKELDPAVPKHPSVAAELVEMLKGIELEGTPKYHVGAWMDPKNKTKDTRTISIINLNLGSIDQVFETIKSIIAQIAAADAGEQVPQVEVRAA